MEARKGDEFIVHSCSTFPGCHYLCWFGIHVGSSPICVTNVFKLFFIILFLVKSELFEAYCWEQQFIQLSPCKKPHVVLGNVFSSTQILQGKDFQFRCVYRLRKSHRVVKTVRGS